MGLVHRERDTWVTRWDAGPARPADPAAHLRAALAEASAAGGGPFVLWVERADDAFACTAACERCTDGAIIFCMVL